MNDMVGFVVTPVNPSDAVTNESCPDIPTPPATSNAPVDVLVEAVDENILLAPPMFSAPDIPAPPETTKDPVVVLVDCVRDVALTDSPTYIAPVIPTPPLI